MYKRANVCTFRVGKNKSHGVLPMAFFVYLCEGKLI